MQPSENGNKQIGLADRSFLNSENGMPPGWLLGGQEATHPVRSRQEENSDKNGNITAETEENKRYQSCSGFHFVSLFVLPWYENSSTHSARYQRPKTPGLLTGHGKEQSQANSHDAGVTAREIRHPSMPGRGITNSGRRRLCHAFPAANSPCLEGGPDPLRCLFFFPPLPAVFDSCNSPSLSSGILQPTNINPDLASSVRLPGP